MLAPSASSCHAAAAAAPSRLRTLCRPLPRPTCRGVTRPSPSLLTLATMTSHTTQQQKQTQQQVRPPMAEVNAQRAAFPVPSPRFERTQPPGHPAWSASRPGLNHHPDAHLAQAALESRDGGGGVEGDAPAWRTLDLVGSDSHQPTRVEPRSLYSLMLGGIAPRPVALVGTYSPKHSLPDGRGPVPNLAPISWYSMVSHDPPMVSVSFGGSEDRRKDSELNLRENQAFCVSMATEPLAEALNFASIDAPRGVSEFALAGLTPVPGRVVKAPRVGESPFQMECVPELVREIRNDAGRHTTTLVVGRVRMIHVREDCIEAGTLSPAKTLPVSRFGGVLYGRTTLGFELERPKYAELEADEAVQEALRRGPKRVPEGHDKHAPLENFP